MGISGACGPPLVDVIVDLACAQAASLGTQVFARPRFSTASGLARQRAPVPEHRLPVMSLCLRPQWMQPSLLFSISLLFLLVRVAFKLRSLRFHFPSSTWLPTGRRRASPPQVHQSVLKSTRGHHQRQNSERSHPPPASAPASCRRNAPAERETLD